MTSRAALLLLTAFVLPLVGWQALGQGAPYASSAEAGNALRDAARALAEARTRAERLEQQAHRATADADRTAAQAAATAARIQQSEAEIRVAQEQAAVVARQRDALRLRMAERQEPVVRLTAALELMARRPLAFSLMRTQSVSETVHLRAVLETMLPEVHRRTTALREEIQRGRALQDAARAAADRLRAGEAALGRRRSELAALESRQRIASRAAQGIAAREADRALALAEQTRDLSALVGQLEADGALREKLAALPGPVQRPARPGDVLVADAIAPTPSPEARFAWVPPVGGRVAFAGPYRGFGRIVVLEHEGGWSSLVTDLGQLDVAVGDRVLQGSPLGSAGAGRATITVELRKDGQPVNPLTLPRG